MPTGLGILDKPALLVVYVFALFLAYIVFNRLSLRIVTGKAEVSSNAIMCLTGRRKGYLC